MKIIICIFFLLSLTYQGQSQSLVITDSVTTPSICFNDGTITVAATGGSGNYTFSIVNGPLYPNISYPITLAPLNTVFLTLPKGQYTIKVTDGSGNTAFATATVGGSYTFPIINPAPPDTVYSGCISVNVQGGKPPYQYARSSLGTNTGFGPYQSSNTFCHLCNGPYWIRVMDSCSNIFTTNKITVIVPVPQFNVSARTVGSRDSIWVSLVSAGSPPYIYKLNSGSISITNNTGIFSIPVRCPADSITVTDSCGRIFHTSIDIHSLHVSALGSCRNGTVVLTIDSESIPPFTITGSNGSLITHLNQVTFTSLPIDSPYHFTVTDSCGNIQAIGVPCDTNITDTTFFYNVCPFDSSIHMVPNPVHFCYPVIVTCLSCSPVQIDTISSTPARLFTMIDTGISYLIRIQDHCGFDYTTHDKPAFAALNIGDSILTCSDFSTFSYPPVFTPPVHYSVYNLATLVDSSTSNHPTFYHLPQGTYKVNATQPLCLARTITVTLPALGPACIVPMFDSSCTPSYAIYQALTNYTEIYTLVNTITSATYIQRLPTPYPNAIVFNNIPVGYYHLVSDSGCSFPFVLPPFTPHTITAYTTHQCTGAALIQAACVPPIQSCYSQSAYYVLLKDNQYIAGSMQGRFTVADTGYYTIRLYLSNTSTFGLPNYDTICPLDTMQLFVINNVVPNLVSTQMEVCGHVKSNIPYSIFGGTAPYTVQILGYPTRIVNSTTDTFPGVYPGTYTMIVSDYCGISRSFSVSVVDTCSPVCTVHSHFSISDTVFCSHGSVQLQNQSSGATHYRWDVNGNVFAYAMDTSFYFSAAGNFAITLYAYIGVCADTFQRVVRVEDTIRSSGQFDTTMCIPVSLRLNTHVANTIWSTGIADSMITITDPGWYRASLTNSCGTVFDTVQVSLFPQILGFKMNSTKNFLCESEPDSVVIFASIDSSGQAPVLFKWNTGMQDSAYSSEIVVYQAGYYQVTAYNGYCPMTGDINITLNSCDSECIAGIAIPNIFSPNGDGKNDTFYILHICDLDPFEMHIYNRWGELVFESPDIHKGWDGRYKGNPEPEEVYWLWLSLTLPDKKTIYRSGTVTLVR